MTDLLTVLRYAASGEKGLNPTLLDEWTTEWAVRAGLAPLILHLNESCASGSPDLSLQSSLRSADIVAKISTGEALDALDEIFSSAPAMAQEITLLKGISICQRLYPQPHLRPLGDIDLWIPKKCEVALDSLLLKLGYRQQSNQPAEFYRTHHHGMPYFHPTRQVWIEVHTALFSNCQVATDPVFSFSNIESQLVPTNVRGHITNRLSDELEMIYLASHWAIERKCFVGGAIPFVDMLYLVREKGDELNWKWVFTAVHGSVVATHLSLMLGLLHKHRLIHLPAGILEGLAASLKFPMGWSERILYGMIERYSMRGEAFGRIMTEANLGTVWETLSSPRPAWKNILRLPLDVLIPPTEPRRFNMAFQLARVRRVLGIH